MNARRSTWNLNGLCCWLLIAAVACGFGWTVAGCKKADKQADAQRQNGSASGPPRDLAAFRAKHPTRLRRHGPPPKSWQDPTPLRVPPGVKEVTYASDGLQLKAWLSQIPNDGKQHPAVVFCHGEFWFGNEDWDVLKPFLDAGFVVMTPRVRAENGNPGEFEYYYGEVNDVIAAGQFLAGQPGIDKSRLFISGHSAGGDLSLLAAMMPNPFAMSAPISPGMDMRVLAKLPDARHRQLVVFNAGDPSEIEARNAVAFVSSLRCPVALFVGDSDWGSDMQEQFVDLARSAGKEATHTVVRGNHGEALPNSIPEIIERFRNWTPR
jgi:dipeptidyl aminopeptidase/acylaminoacyl peptidase